MKSPKRRRPLIKKSLILFRESEILELSKEKLTPKNSLERVNIMISPLNDRHNKDASEFLDSNLSSIG